MSLPSRAEILQRIAAHLADVLDAEPITLCDTTRADAVEGWDSIAHIRLLIALEREFGFEFASDEAAGLEHVGALVDLVQAKLGPAAP